LPLLLLLPLSGAALTIAEIEPLYFEGPGGFGFDPADVAAIGRVPAFGASPANQQYTAGAGSGVQIAITQTLGTQHQNPASPSFASPVIADSSWTLRNDTSATLVAPLLVFTRVDPQGVYPIALPPTGLDADHLQFLRYSVNNDQFLFGAIALPTLRPGETANVLVRYVVAGALAPGDPAPLPRLGVTVLGNYTALVPEPASAALVSAGLIALAARTRARRSRG
jgi:hypothetical protein